MKSLAGWIVMVVVLMFAPAADACPMCALNDKAGLGSWFILAGMLGTPFLITGCAILIMRKIGARSVAETVAAADAAASSR